MKNRKFTWIDGVVVALALALIAGTFFKFFYKVPATVAVETQTLRYTVSASGVRQETLEILQAGDPVFDSNGNTYMGNIAEVQASPAIELREYPDGTLHEVTVEGRYDLIVTIEAEGVDNGDHYQIGTYSVRANRPGTCNTRYTVWLYQILSLG